MTASSRAPTPNVTYVAHRGAALPSRIGRGRLARTVPGTGDVAISALGVRLVIFRSFGMTGAAGANRPPIGTPAADFAWTDDRGDVHRLSDERDRRVVVLVFLGADGGTGKPSRHETFNGYWGG